MKRILLSLALTNLTVSAETKPVYLGTMADGIYLAEFDTDKGTLTKPTLAAKYERPGFLALHPEKPVLYSIGFGKNVAAFSIAKDHSLTFINEADSGGAGPCHLVVDAKGTSLAVANYSGGTVSMFRLDANGKIGTMVSNIKIQGSGPHPERQKAAHTHGVYFNKANNLLFVPDLGTDETLIYKFNSETSEIIPNNPAALKAPPGSGPRHMDFSPDEKHAYIINELTNTITTADFNPKTGSFTDIQTIPTLADDFKEPNTTAEIEVHPNGKFVYGSNRGHNSIVVYKRDSKTGILTFLQHAPCGGQTPRHFAIDPTGKWLLCGHQNSNTLSILNLNSETGLLGEPQSTVEIPSPVCILFTN
ncbi:MAG: lactonase family protein [Verrucomicrobiota bacterium]